MRRFVIVTSVNKRKNNPVKEHHHAMYHPFDKLPNSALLECSLVNSTEEKCWMDPKRDGSAKIERQK